MSSRIRVLPESLANKIAAGEVVERPASVVKELVENSLDAGAGKIFVFIKNGGLDEIRVVDDGIGMNEEEAKLAFMRHATSKIGNEEDLFRITTLGFRGEALPSIAAVSRVELLTRLKSSIVGTRVLVEGGSIVEVEPSGCPYGTSITVRELFYNTPARRKFIKDAKYEFGRIVGVMEKYALAYPNVHFRLVHNGRKVIDAPPGTLADRIAVLWGGDVASKMVGVKREGTVSVSGYVSKPYLTRRDKNKIVTFVNGRYVKNHELVSFVISGYKTLLFRDSYPYAVIMVTLPPEEVDVNVHPSKYQIKFRKPGDVKKAIELAIWETLTAQDNIPSQGAQGQSSFYSARKPVVGEVRREKQMVFEVSRTEKQPSLFDYVSRARLPGYEVLGQFDDTYIIVKSKDSLIIVDQHAAHERIRYEKFLREIKEHRVQQLIDPLVLNLNMDDYHRLLEMRDSLGSVGLIIDDFGDGSVVVRGIPPSISRGDIESILRDILAMGSNAIERHRDEVIKLMSCKGAIKAHDKLSLFEMEELIAQLLKCENPYTCPHGRPTMIRFRSQDLEKMFKRKE